MDALAARDQELSEAAQPTGRLHQPEGDPAGGGAGRDGVGVGGLVAKGGGVPQTVGGEMGYLPSVDTEQGGVVPGRALQVLHHHGQMVQPVDGEEPIRHRRPSKRRYGRCKSSSSRPRKRAAGAPSVTRCSKVRLKVATRWGTRHEPTKAATWRTRPSPRIAA